MNLEHDFRTELADNFLSCPVCYDHFSEDGDMTPLSLYCGHTLCKKCIDQIVYTDNPECPFCRQFVERSGANRYPKNFMVLGLLAFFPKLHEPVALLKSTTDSLDTAQAKLYETARELEYYTDLIAAEEVNLQRLKDLAATAEKEREQSEQSVAELRKTMTLLEGLSTSSASDSTVGPIQCQFQGPPPSSPQSSPPLRRNGDRGNLLGSIQRGSMLRRTRDSNEIAQERQDTSRSRDSMQSQLAAVLSSRRQVNQPAVIVPERGGHYSARVRLGQLSELERVFARRAQGDANWANTVRSGDPVE